MEHDRDYEYIIETDSDEGIEAVSSEDEIEIFLKGTAKEKRHLKRRNLGEASSSSEDEFEKEMNAELNVKFKDLQNKTGEPSDRGEAVGDKQEKFYSEEYFDSDSDEDTASSEKKQKKHPVLSNDDLLYDPNMDDEDQRWVDARRQRYLPKTSVKPRSLKQGKGQKKGKHGNSQSESLPQSDAVLNCPCCMTTLCMDCQRHDLYKNQYRAMFVMNCEVNNNERLQYPEPGRKNAKKRKHGKQTGQTMGQSEPQDQTDLYHPVHCKTCKTEVGVFDEEEIFHFYNVLASYA